MAVAAGISVFVALLSIAILTPPDVARAFAIDECTDGQFTRWEGHYATYDRSHGDFADWWQDEIDEAADIWNDDGGAKFSFRSSSYSSHDWFKQRRIYDPRPGVTLTEWTAPDDCPLVDVDSLFNTRYTFHGMRRLREQPMGCEVCRCPRVRTLVGAHGLILAVHLHHVTEGWPRLHPLQPREGPHPGNLWRGRGLAVTQGERY